MAAAGRLCKIILAQRRKDAKILIFITLRVLKIRFTQNAEFTDG